MKVRDIINKNKDASAIDLYLRNENDYQSLVGTLYKGESEYPFSKFLELKVLDWKRWGNDMVVYALA